MVLLLVAVVDWALPGVLLVIQQRYWVACLEGTSKNSAFAWAGQRDLLQHLEWIEPKTRSEPIFRGALDCFRVVGV